MRRLEAIAGSLCCLLSSIAMAAPAGEAAFRTRLKGVYDFRPRDLDSARQDRKGQQLDALWKDVEREPLVYAPLLRVELGQPGYPAFFYFDGASLLAKISPAAEDAKLAAVALRRAELPDVTPEGYFHLVHRLGVRGADIVDLLKPILDDPDFKVFVPAHSWTMDRTMVVTSCVLVQEPARVVEVLGARLAKEKAPAAARAIITALAFTVTDEAATLLRDYARHPTLPALAAEARTYATFERQSGLPPMRLALRREQYEAQLQAFLDRKYDQPGFDLARFTREAPYLVRKADLPRLRSLRRERAARVSNEAWAELQFLTGLMQYAKTAAK